MEWLPIGWVDLLLLGVVVLSALVGLARGFTFELLSLAGWFAAWFAALWFGPYLAPYLPIGASFSALQIGVAFVLVFVLAMIVWGLAARAVSGFVKATPLRPLDRLLGALFGVARAIVVLLVAATLVGWTPASRSQAWTQSVGASLLRRALQELLPLVPGELVPPPVRRV